MNLKQFSLFFLLLFLSSAIYAQQISVSGYVRDAETGEPLIGANVHAIGLDRGTVTNNFGFYSLSVPSGFQSIYVSAIGYLHKQDTLRLNKLRGETHEFLLFKLFDDEEPEVNQDLNIPSEKLNPASKNLLPQNLTEMPMLLSESDLVKSLQFIPGISGGNEASSSLHVRGGGNDHNLILYDGVPLYNVSHAFGFLSLFNNDLINNVQVYKGGFPARFGGRASSVIDITSLDGSKNEHGGSFSVGLLAAKLAFNGPLSNDGRTTYSFGARRSYLDLLLRSFMTEENNVGFHFFDLNGKITHHINDKSTLSLSLYRGRDKLSNKYDVMTTDTTPDFNVIFIDEIGSLTSNWGNDLASLRYSKSFSKSLFGSLSASYSRYKFNFDFEDFTTLQSDTSFVAIFQTLTNTSSVQNFSLKADMEKRYNDVHFIRYGANYTAHLFNPGTTELYFALNNAVLFDGQLGNVNNLVSHETAVYLEDDILVANDMHLNIGGRFVNYIVGQDMFNFFEPRVAISKRFDKGFSMFTSYTNMNQFVHLVSNSTVNLPTDLWLPATQDIPPVNAQQVSLGMRKKLGNGYEFIGDVYYKWLNNVVDYREGMEFGLFLVDWQERVASGMGTSYGFEWMFQKQVGKLTGWIGGSFSKALRQIDGVNFGNQYNFQFDRPFELSLTLNYKRDDNYTLTTNFVVASGNLSTLPIGRYLDVNNRVIYEYGEKNGHRLAPYHRLDLGVIKTKRNMYGNPKSAFNFSLYNMYANFNPYSINVDLSGEQPVYRESAWFRFVPGVSYAIYF